MSSNPNLSIVLFAYNEEENIGPVLGELRAWLDAHSPAAEVIFVDDGSTDDTAGAAARALEGSAHTIVRHERNRGIGAGLKSGVRAARAAWVTFLPADGQIAPDAIAALWDAKSGAGDDDEMDVVFSVYADRDDGVTRKILSLGVRGLILAVHGVWMQSDGPYLFRRDLFVPEQLPPDTFFLNFEFPIRVQRAGLRTRVVTISCRPRRAGVSKTAKWSRVVDVARDLLALRARVVREGIDQLR